MPKPSIKTQNSKLKTQNYRVGVDTGGTFTDFVFEAEDGLLRVFKLASTPDDPS
jgi:N-methylhydantoinase A/oxoprolinase/acetone carboxylase beta subunit